MGASVFVTEYGAPRAGGRLEAIVQHQDRHATSSTFWPWKERGGWGMFNHSHNASAQNGPIKPEHVRMLSRVLPIAVSGRLIGFVYNDTTRSFAMAATAPSNATTALTEVFVPAHVDGALTTRVVGAATLVNVSTVPDGARTLHVSPKPGGGLYVAVLGSDEAEVDALVEHAWHKLSVPTLPADDMARKQQADEYRASWQFLSQSEGLEAPLSIFSK